MIHIWTPYISLMPILLTAFLGIDLPQLIRLSITIKSGRVLSSLNSDGLRNKGLQLPLSSLPLSLPSFLPDSVPPFFPPAASSPPPSPSIYSAGDLAP